MISYVDTLVKDTQKLISALEKEGAERISIRFPDQLRNDFTYTYIANALHNLGYKWGDYSEITPRSFIRRSCSSIELWIKHKEITYSPGEYFRFLERERKDVYITLRDLLHKNFINVMEEDYER